MESCISDFLDNCDINDDHKITLAEWGKCLGASDSKFVHNSILKVDSYFNFQMKWKTNVTSLCLLETKLKPISKINSTKLSNQNTGHFNVFNNNWI